jgi:crotonobetainyl-CoA:carnitine CoA-transferase CaiB-like acyl-CoA transferase
MGRPLDGLRVLDLTQFLAGPFCTMILGDWGADVIKIEPPAGEPQRNSMRLSAEGESPTFMALNRNKRGIVIDLRTPEGRALIYELVAQGDVLVENYRPGVTTKLGIDYDVLREIRPELIYASITGFGDSGPYADRPGLDLIAQGMAGLMSVTGEPGGEPVKCGVPVTDLTAGMFAVIGILNAHIQRLSTGEGQRVSSSLFEAGLSLAVHESVQYWTSGQVPAPLGSAHRVTAPYQALRTADGYMTVGAGTQPMWERLCATIGREDLLADLRFTTNATRMRHRAVLQDELERTLTAAPTAQWVEAIIGAGIPAGPILDYGQVLEDPHTHAREMVSYIDHPTAGRVPTLGTPVKLSGAERPPHRPAPLLGEHTDEVLAEFGLASDRVAALHAGGVV